MPPRPLLLPRHSLPPTPTLTSNPLHKTPRPTPHHQTRHATLLRRPHRPYRFTQLLTLSDGSTAVHRTTSPRAVYRSTRDVRNAPLWNPSNAALAGVEQDDAGRLRAFRARFGRGWDAPGAEAEGQAELKGKGKAGGGGGEMGKAKAKGKVGAADQASAVRAQADADGEVAVEAEAEKSGTGPREWTGMDEESLMDLINSYSAGVDQKAMQGGKLRRKKGGK